MATCRLLLCAVACKQGKYRHPCQVLNVSTYHDEGLLRRVVQVRRLPTILTLFAIAATLAAGARARNAIEVERPVAFARIGTPVTVSGRSSAYEGTVHVSVLEDRRGPDRVLGKGFVNGGAAELAPFSGRIAFGAPSAEAGWLVFSGDSGGDGGIFDATAVRIRFAGH
jgi:hypothetical protein